MVPTDRDAQDNTNDDSILDLTNAHLSSLESVSLDASLVSLDLTANRLKQLESSLLALPALTTLSLRQNLLEDATDIGQLASAGQLNELILQDNRLTAVPQLGAFLSLQRLELSYNQIKSLTPLSYLEQSPLQSLYVASNKITEADGIQRLTHLTQLDLGCNRLRTCSPVANLINLKELWLGRNRLTVIEHLSRLNNLQQLSLQSNRLESVDGLGGCTALEELYLSHNGITVCQGLEPLVRLKVLDLSSNRITELPALLMHTQLQDLWLNNNQLVSQEHLLNRIAEVAKTLKTLYVASNPASVGQFALREGLKSLPCSCLEQLDDQIWRP